jgi:hypothetical protein
MSAIGPVMKNAGPPPWGRYSAGMVVVLMKPTLPTAVHLLIE